jgi:hypothetical protein
MARWNGRVGAVCFLVAALMTFAGPQARAAADTVSYLQQKLYAGELAEAQKTLAGELQQAPQDDEVRMALGTVEFLSAIETMSQSMYRYGLRAPERGNLIPFFRFPVPLNPKPETITYEKLRAVFQRMIDDLGQAESTLAGIHDANIKLPLSIGLIKLDLNGDRKLAEEETLWRVFAQVAPGTGLSEADARQFVIAFDGSDVPWLRGYCHLLMAMGEFGLAYDWHDAFDTTFQMFFPNSGLPLSVLNEYPAKMSGRPGEYFSLTDSAYIADLIAFVHLAHWPVVEPQRMQRALAHLENAVELSRENWRLILAETDNDREWVPSPRQTSALAWMAVGDAQVEGWNQFLNEFDALLKGKKLLPHWRLEKGVNLRRMFLEPGPFDPVLYAQGAGVLPYAETGELTTADTWNRITQLFEGNFLIYAVWFN